MAKHTNNRRITGIARISRSIISSRRINKISTLESLHKILLSCEPFIGVAGIYSGLTAHLLMKIATSALANSPPASANTILANASCGAVKS